MSRGRWRTDPNCGVSLRKLERAGEEHLDAAGRFDIRRYSDCNVFDVRSIAAAAGFRDTAYFRDQVLSDPRCPLHYYRVTLTDGDSGSRLDDVYMTHQNSAVAGGERWREVQRRAAQVRAMQTLISSGS